MYKIYIYFSCFATGVATVVPDVDFHEYRIDNL